MIFKKANLEDVLASGMDEIMQSEEYKSIFNPQSNSETTNVSQASEQPNELQVVFSDLLKASNVLDNLGFGKVAANVLKIADELLESLEVEPAKDLEVSLDSPVASLEVEEELAELEELKNLLDKQV